MSASPDVGTYLFTQGVLGVVCLVLGLVCRTLYNKVQALQDARLQDAKDVTKDVTTVVQGNAEAMRILAAKIEAGKREGNS